MLTSTLCGCYLVDAMFKGSKHFLKHVCICGDIVPKGGPLILVAQSCECWTQVKLLLLKALVFGTPESLLCPCLQHTLGFSCSEHAFICSVHWGQYLKHFQLVMT